MRNSRSDGRLYVWSGVLFGLCMSVPGANATPGELNPGFGEAGRVSLDPRPALEDSAWLSDAIALRDGRIVGVGTSSAADRDTLVVVRFTDDGSIDSTFGNGGTVTGTTVRDSGRAVIEQSDGKLVVAGSSLGDFALWRFDELGTADAGFGTGGSVRFDLGGEDAGVALVEQPDGRLVVAGSTRRDGASTIALARFNADGSIDRSFASNGVATLDWLQHDRADERWGNANAMARDANNRLIVVGYEFRNRSTDVDAANGVIFRLSADGLPDATFGTNGVVELTLGADTDNVAGRDVAFQGDGRMLVAGGIGSFPGYEFLAPPDGFLARLMPDGTLDPTFGTNGVVIEDVSNSSGSFESVAVLSDDTMFAAGVTLTYVGEHSFISDMSVTRFHADGGIDASFGVRGTAIADFGGFGLSPVIQVARVIPTAEDRLLVAGSHGFREQRIALAQFASRGGGFAGLVGFTVTEQTITLDAEESEFAISVRRTGGSTGAVSVAFETTDRSTNPGANYTPVQGELHWAEGDTAPKTIVFTLLDDALSEGVAHFDVELVDPHGGAVLAARRTSVVVFVLGPGADADAASEADDGVDARGEQTVAASSGGGGSIGALTLLLLLLPASVRFRLAASARVRIPAREPMMADTRGIG